MSGTDEHVASATNYLTGCFWLKTEGDGKVKETMPALIAADLRPVMGLLFPPLGGRRRHTKHRENT